MKHFLAALIVTVFATIVSAGTSFRLTAAGDGKVDLDAEGASLQATVQAVGMKLRLPVVLDQEEDREVTLRVHGVTPLQALYAVAAASGLQVLSEGEGYVLRDPLEPRVSLDVKEVEAETILHSVARQCGIRNLLLDKGIGSKGTFLFKDVPCGVAIRTVLKSLALEGELQPNSILRVGPRH
jgi:type II secretory pathway component GspD/PulD (secretin)